MSSKLERLLERRAQLLWELDYVSRQIEALRQERGPDQVITSVPVSGDIIRSGARRFLVVNVGPLDERGLPTWVKGRQMMLNNRVSTKVSTLTRQCYTVEVAGE